MPRDAEKHYKQFRHTRPWDAHSLWRQIHWFYGVKVARESVCEGHQAPFNALCDWQFKRPRQALMLGPRGGGKSFLAAIDTHLDSRHLKWHATRILAGSLAQAAQIHGGLKEAVLDGRGPTGWSDKDTIRKLTQRACVYTNGSHVSILPSTQKGVRGPHVPSLKLDEVDEIDEEIRQHAMGMVMEKYGYSPKLVMTSTHHILGGQMETLMTAARESNAREPGSFPFHSFCVWEVLKHCKEERSGPEVPRQADGTKYEKCSACPLMKWCYSDDNGSPSYQPKAKRAKGGHYTIDSLIQKTTMTSHRVFEADYLCLGPKADGIWFNNFDEKIHARAEELQQDQPIYVAIDCGVSYHTGAVFFQAWNHRVTGRPCVNVLADYYSEGLTSEVNALKIAAVARDALGVDPARIARVILDPNSSMQTGIGPSARSEYERIFGERRVDTPPKREVLPGLDFLDKMVKLADGSTTLAVHPRCEHVLKAFKGYRQGKRGGHWTGRPMDPCHPAEELMDSLRYGLWYVWPEGYPVPRNYQMVHASGVM